MKIQARVVGVFIVMLSFLSCGPAAFDMPPELAGQQPFVTKVVPEPEQVIGATDSIDLHFSHALALASVNDSSVVVYAAVDGEVSAEDIQERWEDELRGDVGVMLNVTDNNHSVQIAPRDIFPPGRLAVVVTPALSSQDGFPFSQAPGVSNRPYVLWFTVMEEGVASEPSSVDASTSAVTTLSSSPSSSGGATNAVVDVSTPPASLVINEIFYDVPGEDTNGVLFIELRGTPGANIGKYVVRCVNGDGGKPTDTIVLPATATIPDDGFYVIADGMTGNLTATTVANADFVANFDPQNGPDAIQLLSADGAVLDVIGYGTPLPLHDADGLLMYEGAAATKVSAGQSLSRDAEGSDGDQNSVDFAWQANPSPGQ